MPRLYAPPPQGPSRPRLGERGARSPSCRPPDPALLSLSARVSAPRLSSGFGYHQIVAMNNLVASTVPEYLGNFTTLVTGDAPDIGARISREATAGLDAGAGADDHRVAALEDALDSDDSGRQEARAALQRSSRTVIDDHRAGRIDRTGDPRFARRPRFAPRQEQGCPVACLEGGERPRRGAGSFPFGDQHTAAGAHRDAGGGDFCHHAARAVAKRRLTRHRLDFGPD